MIRIINPELFYLEGEDFRELRDICEIAIHFSKGHQLAGMQNGRHERAMALANKIVDLPISFMPREVDE